MSEIAKKPENFSSKIPTLFNLEVVFFSDSFFPPLINSNGATFLIMMSEVK